MMISSETFYDEYLKGKSESEILAVIQSLKQEMARIKEIYEHPTNSQIIFTIKDDVISYGRMYIEKAKQTLSEIGGTYVPSQAEVEAEEFNASLPFVSKIVFNIGGYFLGEETKVITIEDNKVTTKACDHPIKRTLVDGEAMDKDSLLDGLAELHIGEWLKEYNLSRFDYYACDGIQWYLHIYYSNGRLPVKIEGSNDYPYNFANLLQLLDINFFSIKGDVSSEEDNEQHKPVESKKKICPKEYSDEFIKSLCTDKSDSERFLRVVTSSEFYAAVELVVNANRASTSLLQRRLSIGYGRASIMLDYMEDLGLIKSVYNKSPDNILPNAKQFLDDRSKLI